MTEVTILPDSELAQMLSRSTEVRDALLAVAQAGAAEAQRLAQSDAFETGAYMAGITAAVVGLPDGTLAGQVQANDWKSKFVEFGTATTGPKAILRRAGETLGSVTGGTT